MEKKEIVFESTDKYLKHTENGLAGKRYSLIMDEGTSIDLHFTDAETVLWRTAGSGLHWEKYGCLSSGEGLYFAAAILSGRDHPVCATLVLDEQTSLVTLHLSEIGVYPGRPRLARVRILFGAIRRMNEALPLYRHAYSADLAGKKIRWHYSTGFVNTHIYYGERAVRARAAAVPGQRAEETQAREFSEEYRPGMKYEELLYEEPSLCVRIREGVYLLSFIEDNMNRVDASIGGNNLVFLADLANGIDAGRTFSLNREGRLEHGFFRAYGELTEEELKEDLAASPYSIRGDEAEERLQDYPEVEIKERKEDGSGRRRYTASADRGIAGSSVRLRFDKLGEMFLHFLTDDRVLFAGAGEELSEYRCDCLYADRGVWFVNFIKGQQGMSFVLDLAARLTTLVLAQEEAHMNGLIRDEFYFGAIEVPGEELPFRRHTFTSELVGRKVCWHYSPYVNITHCYVSEHYMRSSLHNMQPLPPDAPAEAVHDVEDRALRWGRIFFEEHAEYVKIRDGLFLVSIIEKNRKRIDPLQGGGDMVYLLNTRLMHNYGRGFNTGNGVPSMNLISVRGSFDEKRVPFAEEPSPFRI